MAQPPSAVVLQRGNNPRSRVAGLHESSEPAIGRPTAGFRRSRTTFGARSKPSRTGPLPFEGYDGKAAEWRAKLPVEEFTDSNE